MHCKTKVIRTHALRLNLYLILNILHTKISTSLIFTIFQKWGVRKMYTIILQIKITIIYATYLILTQRSSSTKV